MIRCVVFDFDGTLVLSNEIKHEGFMRLAERFVEGPAHMRVILNSMSGDREAIISRFATYVGASQDAVSLLEEYSHMVREQILMCPERPGAASLLRKLSSEGIRIYVNSATPTHELRLTLKKRYPANTFAGIYGGFGCKLENLRVIARSADASVNDMVMIGDGTDDADAASEFGCRFIAIAGGTLQEHLPPASLLRDLTAVVGLLGFKS
jgi:phosphoglycolate phosphatase